MMSISAPTRITVPTPTRGSAPSHSPPDTRYAPGIGLARNLGWFGIGLGLAEVLIPGAIADLCGVRNPALLRLYGLREIVCGVGILGSTQPTAWLWGRVAGDALDLATVGTALVNADGQQRRRARIALFALTGAMALDVICAGQLSAAASLEG